MAVRLTQIKGDIRTARIDFGDDGDLNFTYRPGVLTPAREEEMEVEQANGRGARATVALLCEIVQQWDLLDDNGEPYALDVDVLMRALPSDVFVMILDAIRQSDRPGEA